MLREVLPVVFILRALVGPFAGDTVISAIFHPLWLREEEREQKKEKKEEEEGKGCERCVAFARF